MTKVFAILDTEENKFTSFNSRCAWSKMGTAKNAFTHNNQYWDGDKGFVRIKYDEQTRYKVVELTEYFYMYKDLEN